MLMHHFSANISIVYRMEFDKTKWSCSGNGDQNCAQTLSWSHFVSVKMGIVHIFPVIFLPTLQE